ncbi:hypothetical protein [uncultured Psychroserpens sp.]|uniref:hypothetical protein n=1 Tax=uncultured Psychroserpens sp. TaxID=255436 RepID=UPI0026030446|nr:hypothetical protein [uncultured Psychroserpens sp.]
MKTLNLFSFFFCFVIYYNNAQSDFLGLVSIDHGIAHYSYYDSDKRAPKLIKVDAQGGVIETYLKLDDGCIENYRFTWKFNKNVSKLVLGEEVLGTISGQRMSGSCYNNTAYITISGSNNGSTLLGNTRPAYGSLSAYASRAHAINRNNNNQSNPLSIEIKRSSVPDEGYFTIRIASTTDASNKDVFDYEIRYNYKKNFTQTNENRTVNCFGLYDFGVTIGMLEYGSLKNDKPSFLVGIIDNSIALAKGVGCIDTSYLESLKSRLSVASSSKLFYAEISSYRQRLPAEILSNCN